MPVLFPLLRPVSIVGALVFGALLALLILFPKSLERSAVYVVQGQVTDAISDLPGLLFGDDKLDDSVLPQRLQDAAKGKLMALSDRIGAARTSVAESRDSDFPEMVAAVIAGHCKCTPPTDAEVAGTAATIRSAMDAGMARMEDQQARLPTLIIDTYDKMFSSLHRDLIIFVATNLAAFGLVFLASFTPRDQARFVVLPGLLLVLSALISSAFYVFNTNWVYTFLFQDYVGLGYTVWMAVIFGALCDITLNKARILSHLPSALTPGC